MFGFLERLLLGDDESIPSLENVTAAHSFSFHTVRTCMGCMKLKSEEAGVEEISTQTEDKECAVGTGEQDISPNKSKLLEVITECSGSAEKYSPRMPNILTPVRPGAAPGVNGQSPYNPPIEETKKEEKATSIVTLEKEDQQTMLRKEVLKHVSNMICGVGSKNNEQNLLR